MQLIIDIGIIALIGVAMLLLCVELGRSQKNAELPGSFKYRYKLHVYLLPIEGVKAHQLTHSANSLVYMQSTLNNISKSSIKCAIVFDNGVLSHTMDATGVLRPV